MRKVEVWAAQTKTDKLCHWSSSLARVRNAISCFSAKELNIE